MKLIYVLIAAASLNACAHRQISTGTTENVPMHAIAVSRVSEDNSVRAPERVKGYPVGRYQDPNDSDVMHERHTVYRVEEDANWDLRPNEAYDVPLGPSIAVSDPAAVINPYAADLENQLSQQQAHNAAIGQQNDALTKQMEEIKAAQKVEADNLRKENEELRQRLEKTDEILNQLKEKVEAKAATPPTVPPPAPVFEEKKSFLPFFGVIPVPNFNIWEPLPFSFPACISFNSLYSP